MPTFVLIHGAGDSPFYWHLVEAELTVRGYAVVVPSLPCDDEDAGLAEYADTVVEAIGDRRGVILVAQSAAAFTAPLVCTRLPVDLIVLVAGLVPVPGETGDAWWEATGHPGIAPEADGGGAIALFYHDVPGELAAEALRHGREQAARPGREPWPLDAWPDVPTRYLLCREDGLLPAGWLRGVVHERLGITPDEIDAGHCAALSRPAELADRLVRYRLEL
jgi:pimeloyl-ACP methyl ester carboxylesterase